MLNNMVITRVELFVDLAPKLCNNLHPFTKGKHEFPIDGRVVFVSCEIEECVILEDIIGPVLLE